MDCASGATIRRAIWPRGTASGEALGACRVNQGSTSFLGSSVVAATAWGAERVSSASSYGQQWMESRSPQSEKGGKLGQTPSNARPASANWGCGRVPETSSGDRS